jgi:dsRNA-specific ribonuclease
MHIYKSKELWRGPETLKHGLCIAHNKFLDKGLLQEALTHPSCERDTLTELYQRLGFLGDAVLDIIVVKAIFKKKENHPKLFV